MGDALWNWYILVTMHAPLGTPMVAL